MKRPTLRPARRAWLAAHQFAPALALTRPAAHADAPEEIALTQTAPDATIKRFENNNATIAAFLSGQVQLIAAGNIVAAAISAKNPPRRPEPKFVIKDPPCFTGLNRNEGRLLAKVNAAIAQAKTDGTLNAMSKKWFDAPLPANL